MKPSRMRIAAFLCCAVLFVPSAGAAPIVSGTSKLSIAAIQNVELLPGTPFNPTASSIFIDDLTAVGSFTIIRDTQVGSTIDFTSGNAYFVGFDPLLGAFELGAGPQIGIGDYAGSISNIVQDPLDPGFASGDPSSLIAGDFSVRNSAFGLRFAGLLVFTKETAVFSGPLDGLPSSPRTSFYSPDPVGVYFAVPGVGDLLVGYSSYRRLVATPEPSGLMLLGAGGVALLLSANRFGVRRRTTAYGMVAPRK